VLPQTFQIDVKGAGKEKKTEEASHQRPVEVDVLQERRNMAP
jgi:hypothetical protein